MKKIIFISLLAIFAGSCNNENGEKVGILQSLFGLYDKNDNSDSETIEVSDVVVESDVTENSNTELDTPTRVYSCGFDGFVAVRESASSKSKIIGRFNNGPEGAILLEDLGEWFKVDVSGLVGYVYKKYVTSTPTIAYKGKVDVNWIAGIWYGPLHGGLAIFNNGYWYEDCSWLIYEGYYIMQNNEVKLIPVIITGSDSSDVRDASYEPRILKINAKESKLGDYIKGDFWSGNEEDADCESLLLTKERYRALAKETAKSVSVEMKK